MLTYEDIINYPKDLGKNLHRRMELIEAAENDKQLQHDLTEICRKDVLFFLNMMVWTYDPRRPIIKNVPFITYPFQDETILWDKQCAEDQIDNLVEKSRDTGCTWMFCTNDLHDWQFKTEKIEIRWGSRKEQYVDTRGDMDCIFEKFRHVLRNLPTWMIPKGFDWKEHDNSMRLINPETGSSITGESANPNFGRGGRKYRIRFDEFAFWEQDEASWQSCADATNCRTAISTPHGAANKFAKLAKESTIRKKALHWTQHPAKNKGVYRWDNGKEIPISIEEDPDAAYKIWLEVRLQNPPAGLIGGFIRSKWYDQECERRGDVKEVAEELDIDYARSGLPFFDLRMVANQIPWEKLHRENGNGQRIPYGRYICANLINIDHRIEVRESRVGWLRIFEMPVKGNQYVVSGDTSEGLPKGDDSFAVVREKWSRNVVAACNGKYDPDDFTFKLQKVGAFYNNAMVAPENNNHGYSVCSDLQKMDCNLYWTRKKTKEGNSIVIKKVKAGFTTTPQTRPEMLDQAREEIRKQACEVRDPVILSQMEVFVHSERNGKPEALGDFLDDGVIAFAIGGQVIKDHPYKPAVKAPRNSHLAPVSPRKHFSFGKK